MALREGIDTDYDEGDQFEEETVRLMLMSKLDACYNLISNLTMHSNRLSS